MTASRELWVCPKCGHTELLLPGVSHYQHAWRKGIREETHVMKKAEQND